MRRWCVADLRLTWPRRAPDNLTPNRNIVLTGADGALPPSPGVPSPSVLQLLACRLAHAHTATAARHYATDHCGIRFVTCVYSSRWALGSTQRRSGAGGMARMCCGRATTPYQLPPFVCFFFRHPGVAPMRMWSCATICSTPIQHRMRPLGVPPLRVMLLGPQPCARHSCLCFCILSNVSARCWAPRSRLSPGEFGCSPHIQSMP